MTHLCRSLRWKGRHGELDAASVAAAYTRNDVPWTCLRTTYPWGPDDGVVDPHDCAPGRACFTPDPRLDPPKS